MKRIWSWLQVLLSHPGHRISFREMAFLGVEPILLYGLVIGMRPAAPYYEQKVRAAMRMERGLALLRESRPPVGAADIEIKEQALGTIGLPWSDLTTTWGSLSSKERAASPDMAAVALDLLRRAGVEKGDIVAIGMTGSLPSLNMAAIIATEELGAIPLVISSIGASSWGANIPGFTWLDMEEALRAGGVIQAPSTAY